MWICGRGRRRGSCERAVKALGVRVQLVAVLNVLAVLLVALGAGVAAALVAPLLGVGVGCVVLGVGCGALARAVEA